MQKYELLRKISIFWEIFIPISLSLLYTDYIHSEIISCYGNEKEINIPFVLLENKIILPIRVNGSRELKIILDTGKPSAGLTLFDENMSDELNLQGTKKLRIRGAGRGKDSYVYANDQAKLSLGEFEIINQRIFILQNNTMGNLKIDGVIGYTLFGSFVVKIDYEKSFVTLFDPLCFKKDKSWDDIPLIFNDKKIPYIETKITMKGDRWIDMFLYIDTGSSFALELLIKPNMKFKLPRNLYRIYFGRGMGGSFFGKVGYILGIRIGSYILKHVETAFPKIEVRSLQKQADGILGGNALRRFNIIFDYTRKKLYIKPNKYFSEQFY